MLLSTLFLAYFSGFILEDKHVQNCFRKWKRTFVMFVNVQRHMLWRQSEKKVPFNVPSAVEAEGHTGLTLLDHTCLNPLWSPASLHLRGWRTFYEALLKRASCAPVMLNE